MVTLESDLLLIVLKSGGKDVFVETDYSLVSSSNLLSLIAL